MSLGKTNEMARLPVPGEDEGVWGEILNDFLSITHNPEGTLKDSVITDSNLASGISQSKITGLVTDLAAKEPALSNGTSADYLRGDKSWQALDKAAVGLGSVDDTSDVDKPISTAQQTALDSKTDNSTTVALDSRVGALESAAIVALSDAATIATDASSGKHFRVSVAGDRTLGIPTNPTDGQHLIWEVSALTAPRILTLTTGSAGSFELTTNISSAITITTNKALFIGAIYSAPRARWTVLAARETA